MRDKRASKCHINLKRKKKSKWRKFSDDKLFLLSSLFMTQQMHKRSCKKKKKLYGMMAAVEINSKMISFPRSEERRKKFMELNHLLQLEISF
jgi:hypothetical protein